MRILFLGAGKRLSLLETFRAAADAEGCPLQMWSIESKSLVPISAVAEIVVGPSFGDPGFCEYLMRTVRQHQIDVVIPNMDAATVALATCSEALLRMNCWPVVSTRHLSETMQDKRRASDWFAEHEIPQPRRRSFPMIIKRRFGYGARDQIIARNKQEYDAFLSTHGSDDYVVQEFVSGQEYTVDAYVGRTGRLIAALSRRRLEVDAGEVIVSETHRHPAILEYTSRILAIPGWLGPITLQFVDGPEGPVILEINPRFGGGVTHSIHCGLDMPRWLIRERLGCSLPSPPHWNDGALMSRSMRDTFFNPAT